MTGQPNSQSDDARLDEELRARLRAAFGTEQGIDDVDEQVERVLLEVARARRVADERERR